MIRSTVVCLLVAVLSAEAGAAGFATVPIYGFFGEGIFTDAHRTGLGNGDLLGTGGPQQVLVNPAFPVVGEVATATYDRMNYLFGWDMDTIAVGAAAGPLQVAVARNEMRWEGTERTAYNPEGSGWKEIAQTMTVFGVAGRFGALRQDGDGFGYVFGLAYRHYDIKDGGSAGGIDAGASAVWKQRHDRGWNSIGGAVSWQNIGGATVDAGDQDVLTPEPTRLGLTIGMGLRPDVWTRDLVSFRGVFTRLVRREDGYDDKSQWGAELMFCRLVSARVGANNRLWSGTTQWGLGLCLDEDFTGPFRAEADWGQIRYDELGTDDDPVTSDGWGVRLAYEF